MELLFVVLGGILLGLAARYAFPGRDRYGALLNPAIGGAVAAIAWVVLLWAGLTFDGGWIWVISLAAAALASLATPILLPPRRSDADAQMLARLSTAGA